MALRCISPYKATRIAFEPGQVVDDPELEAHLLKDSPGSFEAVAPEPAAVEPTPAPTKAVTKPPQDKMLRADDDGTKTKGAKPAAKEE